MVVSAAGRLLFALIANCPGRGWCAKVRPRHTYHDSKTTMSFSRGSPGLFFCFFCMLLVSAIQGSTGLSRVVRGIRSGSPSLEGEEKAEKGSLIRDTCRCQ